MTDDKLWCCDDFRTQATTLQALSGGVSLYPVSAMPNAQYEKLDNGTWGINGCCGGGCFVASNVRYCPHCGENLKEFYGE